MAEGQDSKEKKVSSEQQIDVVLGEYLREIRFKVKGDKYKAISKYKVWKRTNRATSVF